MRGLIVLLLLLSAGRGVGISKGTIFFLEMVFIVILKMLLQCLSKLLRYYCQKQHQSVSLDFLFY